MAKASQGRKLVRVGKVNAVKGGMRSMNAPKVKKHSAKPRPVSMQRDHAATMAGTNQSRGGGKPKPAVKHVL